MFGILNVLKPIGMTSRDCVNRLQRLVYPLKIGHAGTLDPIAEGVLIMAIGQAVRLVEALQDLPKTYTGTFLLGCRSESADTETDVESIAEAPLITRAMLDSIHSQFIGPIRQRPPVYSAVKIDGKRAYKLARKGRDVEMPERSVHIDALDILSLSANTMVLRVTCQSGTYMRSLGRDMARACGSDAVMSQLVREAIGPLRIEEAIPLDRLVAREQIAQSLQNPAPFLLGPKTIMAEERWSKIRSGVYQTLQFEQVVGSDPSIPFEDQVIWAIDPQGNLRAELTYRGNGLWGAKRNFDPV